MPQDPPVSARDPGERLSQELNTAAGDHANKMPSLTSCDVEPITRLERIQSFGFLIAVSKTWLVVRVSANLESMLGVAPSAALGAILDSLVDAEALHEIRNSMAGLSTHGGVERLYGVALVASRPPLDLAIHCVGDHWVLEGEPAGTDSRTDAASLVRKMVLRLNSQTSLDAFHQDAARQVRSLTGFDRAMIYRFQRDGAGAVIAEVVKPGWEKFLGLHYPAADIPVQARALYLRNPFRIIADVGAPTVPLQSRDDSSSEPLDLSLAVTRAVSPVHIEYLRNMGVAASLSISIVVQGKLWGLIACHHDAPKLPTFVTRTAAELFGQMYSMTLESRLRVIEDHEEHHAGQAIAKMIMSIAADQNLLTDSGWLQDVIRELIPCDGVAIFVNGAVSACGATPSVPEVESVAKFLNAFSSDEVFASDDLSALRPQFPRMPGTVSGVLCIPLSALGGDYLMLFRREQLRDIRWAGAPEKAEATQFGERISPRKSFAAYGEAVHGRSRPFSDAEQKVAAHIRAGLTHVILRDAHQSVVEQNLTVGRQELLIAELNHRVRNVLALIRGLISQTRGEGGDSVKYVESLNGRVQALARAHDRITRDNWSPGPLNAIFDDEITAYVPTQRNRFTIRGPHVLLSPQAYSAVALIIHELVTNSCKYGALSDSGGVEVIISFVPSEGLRLKWREKDGPTVAQPTRRGFGSVIIERVVPFDLQGTAQVSYPASGLEAEFFIPAIHISFVDTSVEASRPVVRPMSDPPQANDLPLAGFAVLILEDNLIVALEAEDLLRSLGAASVVAVSTLGAAAKVRDTTSIQFAVLDINLGFENSLGFAASLRAAKIPFLFASGYGSQKKSGESLLAELTVSKPYDREALLGAIMLTLARLAS